jgi:Ca2+-transporting ATPase
MVLKAGHDVPADGRVVFADGLNIDESALTGESVPVGKTTSIVSANGAVAGRINMVHAGTVVADGSGIALVTATGRHTEMGQIRALVAETTCPPPRSSASWSGPGAAWWPSRSAPAPPRSSRSPPWCPGLEMARSAISLPSPPCPKGFPPSPPPPSPSECRP